MQTIEVSRPIDAADSGELFAGYTNYTDAGELEASLGQHEVVNATPTIISVATILLSCLC